MAYFSNGTEGMAYQERYCERCIHNDDNDGAGCVIWDMHLLWNSEQMDSVNAVYDGAMIDTDTASGAKHMALSAFIPEGKDGNPAQCVMFVQLPPERGGE